MDKPEAEVNVDQGKVTLKWKGESVNEFDISELGKPDSDSRKEMIKLMQSGLLYNKQAQHELGTLRKQQEDMNNLFELAKTDDNALALLKGKIEEYVGRPLTKKEEKEVEVGEKPRILLDEEENAKVLELFDKSQSKISDLEKQIEAMNKAKEKEQNDKMEVEIKKELNDLATKYNGKDGNPKFDKEAVLDFAIKNKLENFEHAYRLMNFEQLTKATQKKTVDEIEKNKKKLENVNKLQTTDSQTEVTPPKDKAKSYRDIGRNLLEETKARGESFFTED